MLVRLLYASRAVEAGTPMPSNRDLVRSPSEFNPTGPASPASWCYGGGIFLQAIEGGREAVSDLYGAHPKRSGVTSDVVLVALRRNLRAPLQWLDHGAGGCVAGSTLSILLKYSERAELDPYSVSGSVSLALLEELMATASIIGRA
jgi:hypothetical protein